jgi:hypothetical protein
VTNPDPAPGTTLVLDPVPALARELLVRNAGEFLRLAGACDGDLETSRDAGTAVCAHAADLAWRLASAFADAGAVRYARAGAGGRP